MKANPNPLGGGVGKGASPANPPPNSAIPATSCHFLRLPADSLEKPDRAKSVKNSRAVPIREPNNWFRFMCSNPRGHGLFSKSNAQEQARFQRLPDRPVEEEP